MRLVDVRVEVTSSLCIQRCVNVGGETRWVGFMGSRFFKGFSKTSFCMRLSSQGLERSLEAKVMYREQFVAIEDYCTWTSMSNYQDR